MHRSGACKPAVVAVATLQQRFTRHSHLAIAPGNSSGGRQPAVARESHLQRRFSTQSREYVARAHERRVSVRYAFRKHACRGDSASTTGDRRRCADKHHCSRGFRPTAGLRPLLLYPPRNAIPEQLRNALASASPDSPRRAYARRSWIGYSPFATRDSPFATRYC